MKKLILFLVIIMTLCSASFILAECDVCNETCSPCGGGCTATDLSSMFVSVTDFDTVVGDITGWDTSCITSMSNMFVASDFNQSIGSWDTSQVTDMTNMFAATSFNQDISGWDTGSVTTMNGMFYQASLFDQPIGSWNTSNVIDVAYMFYGAIAFNQSIGSWDTSQVTTTSYMFSNTFFNQDISTWDTSQVTIMDNMFYLASDFNQDISGWDTSQVTDMNGMFEYDILFNQDISGWDTGAVTNMNAMFYGATSFNGNIGSWDVSQVTDMNYMFGGMFGGDILSTTNYDALLNSWAAQSVQSGVSFDAGNAKYSSIGLVGRNILTDTFGWVITDGGLGIIHGKFNKMRYLEYNGSFIGSDVVIKLPVNISGATTNCSDVEFTNNNANTVYEHFTYQCNPDGLSTFYVQIPSGVGGKNYLSIFYDATDKSMPDGSNYNIFFIYDDFNRPDNDSLGNALTGQMWTEGEFGGNSNITNNEMAAIYSSGTLAVACPSSGDNVVVESIVRSNAENGSDPGMFSGGCGFDDGTWINLYATAATGYWTYGSGPGFGYTPFGVPFVKDEIYNWLLWSNGSTGNYNVYLDGVMKVDSGMKRTDGTTDFYTTISTWSTAWWDDIRVYYGDIPQDLIIGEEKEFIQLVYPEDGMVLDRQTSPELKIKLVGEVETVNVSFYDASNDSLICEIDAVEISEDGANVTCDWLNLTVNQEYFWYVNVSTETAIIKSSVWSFTPDDEPKVYNIRIEQINTDEVQFKWENELDMAWISFRVGSDIMEVRGITGVNQEWNVTVLYPDYDYIFEWQLGDNLTSMSDYYNFYFRSGGWKPDLADYKYKRLVTINSSQIGSDLDDYAVNVSLTEENFQYFDSVNWVYYPAFKHLNWTNGNDIRLVNYYETKYLPFEITKWDVVGEGCVQQQTIPNVTAYEGDFATYSFAHDGDWLSQATPNPDGTDYYNYTIPSGAKDTSKFRIHDGEWGWDIDIPAGCFGGTDLQFKSVANTTPEHVVKTYCRDNLDPDTWNLVRDNLNASYYIYETMVTWEFDCEADISVIPEHFDDASQQNVLGIDGNYDTKFWVYYGYSEAENNESAISPAGISQVFALGDEVAYSAQAPIISNVTEYGETANSINISWFVDQPVDNRMRIAKNPWILDAAWASRIINYTETFEHIYADADTSVRLYVRPPYYGGIVSVVCSNPAYSANYLINDSISPIEITFGDVNETDYYDWTITYILNDTVQWNTGRPAFMVDNLDADTTYYYRLWAYGLGGLNTTQDGSFTLGTPPATPLSELHNYTENRPDEQVIVCGELTGMNSESSIDCSIQYWNEESTTFGETTADTMTSTGTFCKTIDVNYGHTYGYRTKCAALTTGYSDAYFNEFMAIQPFFAGNPIEDDQDYEDRQYCPAGPGIEPCYEQRGYREGSLQEEDWIWIETNITDQGTLTVHWWDDGWLTYDMTNDTDSDMRYLELTGLDSDWQTFYITGSADNLVLNWTKPSMIHLVDQNRTDESKYVAFGGTPTAIDYQLLYMDSQIYDISAYRWCIAAGGSLYDCMGVQYWGGGYETGIPPSLSGTSYDRGQLFRGGVINGEMYDTGILTEIRDTGKSLGDDVYNQRYCFAFTDYWWDYSIVPSNNITNYYYHYWTENEKYSDYLGHNQDRLFDYIYLMRFEYDEFSMTRDWKAITGTTQYNENVVKTASGSNWGTSADQSLLVGYVGGFNAATDKDQIYNFGFYTDGRWTNQQFGKYQQAFVIFNLPDNATLQSMDSDSDNLTDYDELYIYYTNPKSNDTDEDGRMDTYEILYDYDPNLPDSCGTDDNACDYCQKCVLGTCTFEAADEDIKDDCDLYFDDCTNAYTLLGSSGFCDGAGDCAYHDFEANVSVGKVCVAGQNVSPSNSANCGIWADCVAGTTNASSTYLVGYAGDGTATCDDTGWVYRGWSNFTMPAGPRESAASVVYDGKMWLFGGNDANPSWNNYNDVWSSTDGVNWTLVTDNASWNKRSNPNAVVFDNKMWIMGGYIGGGVNDVWYSTDGANWTLATEHANWSGRYGFGLVVFNGAMWLISGTPTGYVWDADIWNSTDGISWNYVTDQAWPVYGREYFKVVVFNNTMWLIGGHRLAGSNWYSTDGVSWVSYDPPTGYWGQGTVVLDDKIWITGGYMWGIGTRSDMWYSSDGVNWIESESNAPWGLRVYHESLAYDDKIWLFGGSPDGWNWAYGDLWTNEPPTLDVTSGYVINVTEHAEVCQEILITVNVTGVTTDQSSVSPLEGSTVDVFFNVFLEKVLGGITSYNISAVSPSGARYAATCNYTLFNMSCVVPMQYYYEPGLYDVDVFVSDNNGSGALYKDDLFDYGSLLAMRKDRDYMALTGSFIGLNNVSFDMPINMTNSGNENITAIKLTAYDIPGAVVPSKKILASYFRAGISLSDSVQLENSVEKNIPFALTPGSNSTAAFGMWVSVPADAYPQAYVSVIPWQIIFE